MLCRLGISTAAMVEKVVWRDDAGVDEDAGNDGVQESRILTDERTGSPYDFTDLKLQMKERIEAPHGERDERTEGHPKLSSSFTSIVQSASGRISPQRHALHAVSRGKERGSVHEDSGER